MKIFIRLCIFSLILIFVSINQSCRKEMVNTPVTEVNLSKAEQWFANYKKVVKFSPLYDHTRFQWKNAAVQTFENGNKAIVVPMFEKNQNPEYTGRRYLFLFPWKKGQGFFPQVYEILPTKKHLNFNNGKINYSEKDLSILKRVQEIKRN